MPPRTLYLYSAASASGPAGRKLCDSLRERSEDSLVARRVLPSVVLGEMAGEQARESLSEEFVREFAPNLIYIEGGLYADERGAWKIDWPVVEDLVDRGAVLILADCGTHELSLHREGYSYAARFLRARPQFAAGGVVYTVDETRYWQHSTQILCRPEQMSLSEWLRPVYDGIDEILVGHPARLCAWQEALLSGNRDSTEVREPGGNGSVGPNAPCVLGSTARCGLGHVAFIAGEVSADRWATRCPGNIRWLVSLAEYLACDANNNQTRIPTPRESSVCLFFAHRSVNRQLVARIAQAVEESGTHACHQATRAIAADSLAKETAQCLQQMTHFVFFWSRACLGAPWVERELGPAVELAIERKIPTVAVRFDFTPLPEVMKDAFRLEGVGMSPQEIARGLLDAVQRIARNMAP